MGTNVAIGYPPSGTTSRRAPARRRRRAPSRRRARKTGRQYATRRLTTRQRGYSSRGIASGGGRMSKFLLGQIDPFKEGVRGAKIPDSNTYPSTSVCIEDEISMAPDATFNLVCKAYSPIVNNVVTSATSASANSWTWAAAYAGTSSSSRYAAFNNNFELYRPVAHGIRLYCPSAPTTTTGFVHVAIYCPSDFNQTTWALPTSISAMNNCMWYRRFPLAMLTQKSVTVVNKFLDATAARYIDPTTTGSTNETSPGALTTTGWGMIIVAVESATGVTNALVVESIVHTEALPLFSGSSTATAAAPYSVQDLQAVSRMSGHVDSTIVQGEETSHMQQAMNAIGRGVGRVGDYIVGPGGPLEQYATATTAGFAASAFNWAAQRGGGGISGVTNPRLQSGFARGY